MINIKTLTKTLVIASLSTAAWAAEPLPLPVPAPPPQLQSGEALEPEVTIRKKKDETVYEYRVNGHLYMVRVIPSVGPPYFFFDTDGDGDLDASGYEPAFADHINMWELFRW